ncbi:hypothetical protein [Mycolicibacterium sp. 050158]|uniref:hypothetical protein n=1 Tax=Mycolicibacterium sp. 050158 TaxID=3090602 RepID=UPI00299E3763|nr:hypothetical protein [Mycolicibacterium sp. 050158]MDX1890124.1 hypothetical protein [Mycolicibacterium sp. 050158]
MKTTTAADDQVFAARWEIDNARGHLDTAACQISDAVGYLDDARRARAAEILDRVSAALVELDRLRRAL